MSPEKINIAIAELRGYVPDVANVGKNHEQVPGWWMGGRFGLSIPSYYDDLNCCHAVEMWMRGTDEQYYNDPVRHQRWKVYQGWLMENYGASASAPQRCEALLRLFHQWVQEDPQ